MKTKDISYWAPVRRHRCEVCGNIFECHVCKVGKDHPMHGGARIAKLADDPVTTVFVCAECCISDNSVYVRPGSSRAFREGDSLDGVYWNYLTGEKLTAAQIGRGRRKRERFVRTRKRFLMQ